MRRGPALRTAILPESRCAAHRVRVAYSAYSSFFLHMIIPVNGVIRDLFTDTAPAKQKLGGVWKSINGNVLFGFRGVDHGRVVDLRYPLLVGVVRMQSLSHGKVCPTTTCIIKGL